MKKLFMFLAVAGLATFGASCSSDDSKNDDPKQKDLVLSGKTDVKEGDAVTFTVKVGDKAEAGTDLYVAGEKVSNPYTFTKKGEFKVQAKKNGFNDSNVLTVKVSDKDVVGPDPDPKKLVLSVAGVSEVEEGAEVNFIVKDGAGAVVGGVVIKKGTEVVSNPWIAAGEGTFKFVASKEGYENSNEVSVVVKQNTIPANFVKVNGVHTEITNLKRVYINAVKNAQGQFQPFMYTEEGRTYSVVTYELGTIDEEAGAYVTRSSTIFITNQVIGQPYVWPGNLGEDTFITSSAVADFEAGRFVAFDLQNDLIDLEIADSETDFLLNLHVENQVNGIKFDGTLGTNYYWREVNADGSPKAAATVAKVSAKFLQNSIFGGRKK
ncbi:hypothetical protein [Myroides odoratus]|uniref:Uncharacterized protein n=1 Tax=Myroides odoratus TaxID=256 RepID=A0A9Q7E7H6_MYROD|nr:hypothetical protein [Myroides odoratus]EHQ42122.1 hypothetical protein Myrod_1289 [Myroides odoratus DSM 2801]EKB09384.1 hypothetical protein HMPREF9716_00204 [Myroides odoratus CIP 103059]QQT99505.1 hypothetical protein I6I88_15165 [Myroides odoratus]WQD58288.1 hypothetical protein U0010_03790 [Myroides odoratus]STZ29382.1 Uncharacterised protein [Myroides odoratus]